MKNFKILFLSCFALLWAVNISAQCTEFVEGDFPLGGPFGSVQGAFPCGATCGTPVVTGFEVFANEAYLTGTLDAGNEYTVSLTGANACVAWNATITIAEWDAATSTVGTVVTFANSCSVTFNTPATGDYIIIITETGVCPAGGANPNGVDGGNLSVDCGPNGANNCSCAAGDLASTTPQTICGGPAGFVTLATDGTEVVPATGGYAFCFSPGDGTATGGNPGTGANGTGFCITGSDPAGELFNSDVSGILSGNNLPPLSGEWIFEGVAFSDVNDFGGSVCSVTASNVAVNFVDYAVTATASYDCATNEIIVDVTAFAADPDGQSYVAEVIGQGVTAPVTGVGMVNLGPLTPDQTYNVSISRTDGTNSSFCDLFIDVIPSCFTPCTGGADVVTDGGFEAAAGTNWTEVSTTAGTPTTFGVVDATFFLTGAQGAWLGGFNDPMTITSVEQSVTVGAGQADLYFWLLLDACDSASDLFTVTVGGTTVYSTNGADANCDDLTWHLISVDLTAAGIAPGTYPLRFEGTNEGVNGGVSNFIVDDAILEVCPTTGCQPSYTFASTLTETATVDYETDGNITSAATIASTAIVDYDSATDIDLLADFCVQLGAEFHAFIDGCGGSMFNGENNSTLLRNSVSSSKSLKFSSKTKAKKASYKTTTKKIELKERKVILKK